MVALTGQSIVALDYFARCCMLALIGWLTAKSELSLYPNCSYLCFWENIFGMYEELTFASAYGPRKEHGHGHWGEVPNGAQP